VSADRSPLIVDAERERPTGPPVGCAALDDAMSDALYAAVAPYDAHTGLRTTNGDDNIFDSALVVTAQEAGGTYTAVHNVLVAG
jgi:hypothetical protein